MKKHFLAAALSTIFISSPATATTPGPVFELSSISCPRIIQPVLTGSDVAKDLPLNVNIDRACACAGDTVSRDPRLQALNLGSRDNLKAKLQDKQFAAYLFMRTLQASFSCASSELGTALDAAVPNDKSGGG